jgi:hypothetical protein
VQYTERSRRLHLSRLGSPRASPLLNTHDILSYHGYGLRLHASETLLLTHYGFICHHSELQASVDFLKFEIDLSCFLISLLHTHHSTATERTVQREHSRMKCKLGIGGGTGTGTYFLLQLRTHAQRCIFFAIINSSTIRDTIFTNSTNDKDTTHHEHTSNVPTTMMSAIMVAHWMKKA